MVSMYFVYLLLGLTGFLWICLLIVTLYQTNTSILRKKGYDEEYIAFLKEDSKERNLGIAVAVPLILVFSGFVVWLIFGELSSMKHLFLLVVIWFLCIIPFPILDAKKTKHKLKELAMKTKSDIVVDLNYAILHLVFRPSWELAAALLYILYFALFFRWFHPAVVHFVLLWIFYATARSGKYLIKPSLRDSYLYNFFFMVINHILLIFQAIWHMVLRQALMGWQHYVFGVLLIVILLGKLIYYLSNFPRFKRKLTYS